MSKVIKLIHYHDRRYTTRDDVICLGCGNTTAYVSPFGIVLCEKCDSEDVTEKDGAQCKSNDFLYQP
jgi:hypothetical protein